MELCIGGTELLKSKRFAFFFAICTIPSNRTRIYTFHFNGKKYILSINFMSNFNTFVY